jgi:hypothetical protein
MLALILATKKDNPKEFSRSTLIGKVLSYDSYVDADRVSIVSCPTICAVKLGEADRRALHTRGFIILRLLWCKSFDES